MNPPKTPPGGPTMSIGLIPASDVRKALYDVLSQATRIRAELLTSAGTLQQMREQILLATQQLRVATLGQLPAQFEGVMPTDADMEKLTQVLLAVAELGHKALEVANIAPPAAKV